MELNRIIAERKNKTIYCDENKVYKVFDQSYSKADVLNEALNQARIEGTGLNIPKVLEVTMIDGKWTIFEAKGTGGDSSDGTVPGDSVSSGIDPVKASIAVFPATATIEDVADATLTSISESEGIN